MTRITQPTASRRRTSRRWFVARPRRRSATTVMSFAVLVVVVVGVFLAPAGAARPKTGELVFEGLDMAPDPQSEDCDGRVAVSVSGSGRYVTHQLEVNGEVVAREELVRVRDEWVELFWTIRGGADQTFEFAYTGELYATSSAAEPIDTLSESINRACETVLPQPYLDGFSVAGPGRRPWSVAVVAAGYGDPLDPSFTMSGRIVDDGDRPLSEVVAGSCYVSENDRPEDPAWHQWVCDWRFDGIDRRIEMVTFEVIVPDSVPPGAATSVDIHRNA